MALNSNAAKDPPAKEGQFQVVGSSEQLREMIAKGSLDFDSWTALIAEIEKSNPTTQVDLTKNESMKTKNSEEDRSHFFLSL
ncbi:unnamed protein product [Ilex paraguariensis]|uniref:Uncharacterized protein n=1 Tax=Ilex paraguariensis TaxID=185542 RepID=A0ABC8R5E6_9AQUA